MYQCKLQHVYNLEAAQCFQSQTLTSNLTVKCEKQTYEY